MMNKHYIIVYQHYIGLNVQGRKALIFLSVKANNRAIIKYLFM